MRLTRYQLDELSTDLVKTSESREKEFLAVGFYEVDGYELAWAGWPDGLSVTVLASHPMAGKINNDRNRLEAMPYEELEAWVIYEAWPLADLNEMK